MDDAARGTQVIPPRGVPPGRGQCHLWRACLAPPLPGPGSPGTGPPGTGPLGLRLLDAAERDRAARFRAPDARDAFVASRTAQRLVAGHYLGRPAGDVAISRACRLCGAEHGRPHVDGAPVDFSVSHAAGWLVIAVVGAGRKVGVDVESAGRHRHLDELADRVLTPAERDMFRQAPREDRAGWFLRAWTRKEAVVKLTGHGLAAPFSGIDVAGPVALAEAPPAGWPTGPIHLLDVPAGAGRLLSLASTGPVTGVLNCGPLSELVPRHATPAQ